MRQPLAEPQLGLGFKNPVETDQFLERTVFFLAKTERVYGTKNGFPPVFLVYQYCAGFLKK